MLVLFPSLVFSFVACSLANCTILYLTGGLCFLLQWWIVRYGLITQSTNLNMREFPRVRVLLAGLTSKKVRVLVFMILHAFPKFFMQSSWGPKLYKWSMRRSTTKILYTCTMTRIPTTRHFCHWWTRLCHAVSNPMWVQEVHNQEDRALHNKFSWRYGECCKHKVPSQSSWWVGHRASRQRKP